MNKSRLRSCCVETVLIATAAFALVRQGRTSPPYDSPSASHRIAAEKLMKCQGGMRFPCMLCSRTESVRPKRKKYRPGPCTKAGAGTPRKGRSPAGRPRASSATRDFARKQEPGRARKWSRISRNAKNEKNTDLHNEQARPSRCSSGRGSSGVGRNPAPPQGHGAFLGPDGAF